MRPAPGRLLESKVPSAGGALLPWFRDEGEPHDGDVPEVVAWLVVFIIGAAVLARAGLVLVGAADELAERTGLGRLFVGSLLLAFATSLPEVVTDVTAAAAGAPDIAVGDLFGSSAANMAILAVLDLSYRHRVWPSVELGHARVATVAIGLTALAAMAVLTPEGPSIGWVGVDTMVVAGAYLAAVAWFRRSPSGRSAVPSVLPVPTGLGRAERHELRSPLLRFAAGAGVVLVVAPVIALSARGIADASGMGESFVGVGLVAMSTSLPELVASLAAVRIGSYDLAVGNLFGSNAANMAVLLVADLAYTDGALLGAVDLSQAVAGLGAIVLMALALAAIVHGEETRVGRMEPDALVLLIAYVGVLVAVGVGAG